MSQENYQEAIKGLNEIQYKVTQENATERPFSGEYADFYETGIYVDIVSGEPLLSSAAKYVAGSGWPALSKQIQASAIVE